ncbi:carbohydrate kinase [Antarcticibacterium flavum]|uniref:Carbohydrate kinase n=1 Tax=Antarcticibacterium flavum TaxID=2058175 RepID=A0A5B7X0X1_9FLAO|nr:MULTISPECIES: carbohydrate kinase [Antarcticibacterium]MCM4160955.1 carbohydrate kinase [Antarcticibacterium sp. W02-3]QCY68997.1 carbohydrate kinase [Antarcticibacterium flavum]
MSIKAICFGEVLWDVFPDKEERIGGAPLNVASRLSAAGIEAAMISKVGDDEKGEKAISFLKENGVDTPLIEMDAEQPTGIVLVTLDKQGSAYYDIAHPAAWDRIELKPEMKSAVAHSDAFIYGSLACRDEISRNTLFALLEEDCYKIFDVNLRPPHYKTAVLEHLMHKAHFIKFNDDELYEIAKEVGSPYNSLEQNLHYIAEKTKTATICVTKGRHGAVLLRDDKLYYNSGFKIKVRDTVGAGDSFLASLIAGLLKEEEPQKALDYACAIGALVASREGANPELTEKEVAEFMEPGE